jgi:hypothetical protein
MQQNEWNENTTLQSVLTEATTATRYSVEVNYRSNIKEVAKAFAKIALGYVSAALKQDGYHIKHVYEEEPLRILISSRNWDDGEWVGCVSFNPDHEGGCFVISKGFFNKMRKTLEIQSKKKCEGDSAADITKTMRNIMSELKGKPDRRREKLKGVPMKRGPKK